MIPKSIKSHFKNLILSILKLEERFEGFNKKKKHLVEDKNAEELQPRDEKLRLSSQLFFWSKNNFFPFIFI